MHKRVKRKKIKKYGLVTLPFIFIGIILFIFTVNKHKFVRSDVLDNVIVVDDGRVTVLPYIKAQTVADVLTFYDKNIANDDRVFPSRDADVFSDDIITIERKKTLTVSVDGEERIFDTYGEHIGDILTRNNVVVDDNDIIVPRADTIVVKDANATIIRVEFKEEKTTKKIPFKTVVKEDDSVNFLKRYTKQEGENGTKEVVYRVAYHDGKEVDREKIREDITKKPTDEIIVQGTKVKLGKKHSGACSWYAHTGTMSAANQWLPIGSYVKVTNKANGKSVIVRINDRGPFVAGRIIDLDRIAFQKIASLGSGVIDVKMEEIIE